MIFIYFNLNCVNKGDLTREVFEIYFEKSNKLEFTFKFGLNGDISDKKNFHVPMRICRYLGHNFSHKKNYTFELVKY